MNNYSTENGGDVSTRKILCRVDKNSRYKIYKTYKNNKGMHSFIEMYAEVWYCIHSSGNVTGNV